MLYYKILWRYYKKNAEYYIFFFFISNLYVGIDQP